MCPSYSLRLLVEFLQGQHVYKIRLRLASLRMFTDLSTKHPCLIDVWGMQFFSTTQIFSREKMSNCMVKVDLLKARSLMYIQYRISSMQRQQAPCQHQGALAYLLKMAERGKLSHVLWGKLSHVLWGKLSHVLWGKLSHVLWGKLSHVLWGELSHVLWGKLSHVLWGKLSHVLWGKLSHVLWGKLSHVLWGELSHGSTDVEKNLTN